MTKYEFANIQAKELVRLEKKKKKINERIFSGDLSYKQTQKIHADLSWVCMHISMCEERLSFALGFITLDQLTAEYKPSGWHTYSGLRKELENLKFD
jgi:hypothetical protein